MKKEIEECDFKELLNRISLLERKVIKLENMLNNTNSDISNYHRSRDIDDYVSKIWPK